MIPKSWGKKQREDLIEEIKDKALAWQIAEASVRRNRQDQYLKCPPFWQ